MAVGTTDNRVAVLHYPSLEPAVPVLQHKSEVVDLDWGGEDGRWVSFSKPFLARELKESVGRGDHRFALAVSPHGRETGGAFETINLPAKYRHRTSLVPFSSVSSRLFVTDTGESS